MTIWIFREDEKYGGYRVVRETPKRWYFKHVCGDASTASLSSRAGKPKPGYVFNYHDDYWLDKQTAELRCIAKVPDADAFVSLVFSHAKMIAECEKLNAECTKAKHEAQQRYKVRVSNMVL